MIHSANTPVPTDARAIKRDENESVREDCRTTKKEHRETSHILVAVGTVMWIWGIRDMEGSIPFIERLQNPIRLIVFPG